KEYFPLYVTYEGYKYHTKSQKTGLAKACAALEFAIQYCIDHPELTRRQVSKKTGRLIKLYNMPYVPSSTKRLLEKVDAFFDEEVAIVDQVYLPRTGNANAELDIPEKVKAWAMQLRIMGQNYSNEFIIRKVYQLCDLH